MCRSLCAIRRRGFCVLVVLLFLPCAGLPARGDASQAERAWETLFAEAVALQEEGRLRAADDRFARAARLARHHALDPDYERAALGGRHECLRALFDYLERREVALRFLEIARGLEDDADLVDALLDVGLFQTQLGNTDDALEVLNEAIGLAHRIRDDELVACANVRIAYAEIERGRIGRALAAGEAAAEAYLEIEDPVGRRDVAAILGRIYMQMGDHKRALGWLRKGVKLVDPCKSPVRHADFIRDIASCRACQGLEEEGREGLERALAICLEAEATLAAGVVWNRLGALETAYGHPEAALEHFEHCSALAIPVGSVKDHARLGVGLTLWQMGREDEALEVVETCIDSEGRPLEPSIRGAAASAAAVLRAGRGAHEQAREHAVDALDALTLAVAGLPSLSRLRARSEFDQILDNTRRTAFLDPNEAAAFTLLERSRVTSLAVAQADARRAATTGDTSEFGRTRVQLAGLEHRYRALDAAGVIEPLREVRAQVAAARGEYLEQLLRAERAWPPPRILTALEAANLGTVQKRLRDDEAIVLFAVDGARMRALVVEPGDARRADLGPTEALQAELEDVRDRLADLDGSRRAGASESARPSAEEGDAEPDPLKELHAKLLGRLNLSAGVKRVYVSPDAMLGHAPFTVLRPDVDFVFVPSATAWVRLRAAAPSGATRMLALGDPAYTREIDPELPEVFRRGRQFGRLPETRLEVLAVTREGDVRLLGEDANETAFLQAVSHGTRWRSVHIACHGGFDARSPEWSFLALTPSDGDRDDDGFLSVAEVFGLRIPTDLVVLSACETGLADPEAGAGMVGLASAFLHAGAQRVIASLWSVESKAAAAFMMAFYKHWNPEDRERAKGAVESLRLAREEVRKTPGWEAPRYWAAWVLWGRAD